MIYLIGYTQAYASINTANTHITVRTNSIPLEQLLIEDLSISSNINFSLNDDISQRYIVVQLKGKKSEYEIRRVLDNYNTIFTYDQHDNIIEIMVNSRKGITEFSQAHIVDSNNNLFREKPRKEEFMAAVVLPDGGLIAGSDELVDEIIVTPIDQIDTSDITNIIELSESEIPIPELLQASENPIEHL